MKSIAITLFKYLFGFLGIILISCTPALFTQNNFFDFPMYFTTLGGLVKDLLTPSEWHLSYNVSYSEERHISFSDFLSGPYLYSMTILLISIILSFVVALFFAFLTMLANSRFKRIVLRIAKLLESFPEFLYVFLIQIVVVQVFVATGFRLFSFYSLGGKLIYAAPIFCLSVLPTLLFFKLLILLYEEELEQPYVELAKSKGLSKVETLIKHCSSNVLKSVFYQSKTIVWLTLSSLFIMEYLFGGEGIFYYLLADFSPKGITFILLTIFTPFFMYYVVAERFIDRENIQRNVIFEKFSFSFLDSQQAHALFLNGSISSNLFAKRANVFKRMDVIIPFFLVLGLLSISFLYSIQFDGQIDEVNFLYDDAGKLVSKAPHPPSASMPLGTDFYGYSIYQQLLVGIKYTILATLFIATLRIVAGYLFAIVYVFYLNNKSRKVINAIADGMHFLPLTLLVCILLVPSLTNYTGVWETTLMERLSYQILIMSIIVLPITTSSIGNEMNETLKKEYIQSSVIMGGSLIWVIYKHINPQLWPKLVLLWAQHVVQVLQMFVHLGILSVFLGGATYYFDSPNLLKPDIYELSGMIANAKGVFLTNEYWMILPPLFIFMLLIYCFNMIADGISKKPMINKK